MKRHAHMIVISNYTGYQIRRWMHRKTGLVPPLRLGHWRRPRRFWIWAIYAAAATLGAALGTWWPFVVMPA